ncbi:hypothetical protein D3C85_1544510 [compost metagenome]
MGLVAQHCRGITQWAALLAGTLTVALHRNGDLVDHAGHFGRRFPQWFTGFFADAVGQFVRVVLQAGGKGLQHTDALLQGTLGPGRECLARGLHGTFNLSGIGALPRPQHLLGHRVQRFEGIALTGQPLTCDV